MIGVGILTYLGPKPQITLHNWRGRVTEVGRMLAAPVVITVIVLESAASQPARLRSQN
jgi:hypothetical protein